MKTSRRRQRKPQALGGILEDVLKRAGIDAYRGLHRIWKQWPDLVGPAIAENTKPTAIKGKYLLVNVSSAPWMQELQYLKPELIRKLNQAFEKEIVSDIRFQIGPVGDKS